jgi:hypothetical protein
MQSRSIIVGGACLAVVWALGAARPDPTAAQAARGLDPVTCTAAVQHPLTVRVRALDPIARGQVVRVEVEVRSRHALERGEVVLTSAGGATLAGPDRAALGALGPGGMARASLAVRVPEHGRRFLLQFQVRGEGEEGLATRGASYNLLPDGPADAGRWFTTPEGVRIAEFRARRIDR